MSGRPSQQGLESSGGTTEPPDSATADRTSALRTTAPPACLQSNASLLVGVLVDGVGSGAEVKRERGGGRGAPRPELVGRSDRLRPKGFQACCGGRGAPRPPPPPK